MVGRLERVVKQLQSGLIERDQQLPEVLAALVAGICERVIGTQLADGAVNIHRFVQHALAELPSGEEEVKVFVGPDDARHLQASLEVSGQELHYSVDDKLPAGNCRIESEHSLVEYSSAEYLNQLLDNVLPQLMHQAASFPDEDEQAGWQEPESVVSAAVMDIDIDSPTDSAAELIPAESDNEAPAPDSLPIDKDETDNVWPEGDGHEPE